MLFHIVGHFSFWQMIVNSDSINGNEKTIAAKEKVIYTQDYQMNTAIEQLVFLF